MGQKASRKRIDFPASLHDVERIAEVAGETSRLGSDTALNENVFAGTTVSSVECLEGSTILRRPSQVFWDISSIDAPWISGPKNEAASCVTTSRFAVGPRYRRRNTEVAMAYAISWFFPFPASDSTSMVRS